MNVMAEALQRHFAGIDFRERKCGTSDRRTYEGRRFSMSSIPWSGRNIPSGVSVHQGGKSMDSLWKRAWMDKMGSSDKAGNRGEPATPRDGAAVEIQALAYSVLNAMSEWANAGVINKNGVSSGDESWAWSEWAEKIKSNFEQQFFIDENHDGQFVNQRNILKDTVGSTLEFTDYQLRCNFVVALATVGRRFSVFAFLSAWVESCTKRGFRSHA
ncbi:Amylo-alpha-1,6-glucosidase, partial [Ostertagia ostertagi]